MDKRQNTIEQFEEIKKICRTIFEKKMLDYGTSWRVMRPMSLTDQIYIKAKRIRTLEVNGIDFAAVNEGIEPEFIGIVNYCAMALIQMELGPGESLPPAQALELYEKAVNSATSLMVNKNHDYDEACEQFHRHYPSEVDAHQRDRIESWQDHHLRGYRCQL